MTLVGTILAADAAWSAALTVAEQVRGFDVLELDPAAVPAAAHVVSGVGAGESADPADAVVALDCLSSLPGVRRVPMSMLVRRELGEPQLRSGRRGDELVFGRTRRMRYQLTLLRRTRKAWPEDGLVDEWAAEGWNRRGSAVPALTA